MLTATVIFMSLSVVFILLAWATMMAPRRSVWWDVGSVLGVLSILCVTAAIIVAAIYGVLELNAV